MNATCILQARRKNPPPASAYATAAALAYSSEALLSRAGPNFSLCEEKEILEMDVMEELKKLGRGLRLSDV